MSALTNLRRRLAGGRGFAGAIGAMAVSEGTNRLTRLLTAILMARYLSAWEFGLVAVALTTTELLRVLTASGLGASVIRSSEEQLDAVCTATSRLTIYLYLAVFTLQVGVAWPVAQAYGESSLTWLILCLALPLLIYPLASVNVFRIQRARRAKVTATMMTMQLSLDNVLTVLLLVAGFGVWAVVWPKVAVAIIWVVAYRRFDRWRPTASPVKEVMRECWQFSRKVLGSECLQALRTHSDKLIIAKLLGLEAAGIYYFAFNAGVGITTGLVNAFVMVLLPEICSGRTQGELAEKWRRSTAMIYAVIAPLIFVQIALAPWYVPLVFGDKWAGAVPLVMLLCAGALALPLWRSVQQLLRARGQAGLELTFNLVMAATTICTVFIAARFSLMAVATSLLVINLALPVVIAALALKKGNRTPTKEVIS